MQLQDGTRDEPSAVEMFLEAAEQGDALSQFEIAEALLRGEGVAQDEALAMSWMRKAAAQGHALAQHSLAECLEAGRGVARDPVEAALWFRRAEAHGDATAVRAVGWKARLGGMRPVDDPPPAPLAVPAEAPTATRDGEANADTGLARQERTRGALLVGGSAFAFATSSLLVRVALDEGFGSSAVAFYNGALRLLLCALFVALRGADSRHGALCAGRDWRFVALCALRQTSGVVSILCSFGAYARIPIGDATSLIYSSPVWAVLIAAFWLREPLTRARLVASALVCAGVVLVAKADRRRVGSAAVPAELHASMQSVVGSVLALTAAVALATMVVTTRAIGTQQDAVALTMWLGGLLSASALAAMAATGEGLAPADATARSWLALVGLALTSLVANVCLNLGLQRLDAAPAAVISSLELLFAYFFQSALLGQPLRPAAVVGGALIAASALGTSYAATTAIRPSVPMAERDEVRPDAGVVAIGIGGAVEPSPQRKLGLARPQQPA
ncbi:hypothetical protein KFE25_002533 [Diacronema lutheri]|uniref:EamA domain-containing protein n=2 Tax=Diacronema lutheri TaxID=2081491 RepID=A0A8J6C5D1_DIALT|nr:hypothetical protein KFE25_002533 [Diacronema lutheri]